MQYKDVIDAINFTEALLRVHKHSLTLNASATQLLGLEDGDKIRIIYDVDEQRNGRDRLYIGKCNSDIHSIRPVKRGGTFVINSIALSRYLSERMQGRGVYRICPEDKFVQDGITWYNIYFRNYK